jgi:putative membrane protein
MSSAFRGADRRRRNSLGLWRSLCLASGLAVVVVALASPLDSLAHELFAAHMAQHMLLVACAAPLIALGRPWQVIARAAPRGMVRSVARAARPLRRGRRRLPIAAVALGVLAIHVGAVWAWHVPALYAVALERPAVHALSHASLLATAIVFWSFLIAAGRRGGLGRGVGIAIAFGAAAGTGILGALLTFATTPLYPEHVGPAAERGMTPIGDQQLGGLLMWIPGGMVYLVAVLALLVGLLSPAEPRARRTATVRSERIAGT